MISAVVGALVSRCVFCFGLGDVCFGMHGMIWGFQKVLKGDNNSINFKHLSLESMFRCIFFGKKHLKIRNYPQGTPPKKHQEIQVSDFSSGRLLHWKKMKPSWYHASPIVPASSGRSIFVWWKNQGISWHIWTQLMLWDHLQTKQCVARFLLAKQIFLSLCDELVAVGV